MRAQRVEREERNRLVHAYFDINLDVVWSTATAELPVLIQELEKLDLAFD